MIVRRRVLIGAAATLVCAPAVVRAASLMPVRIVPPVAKPQYYGFCERLYVAGHLPIIRRFQNAGFSSQEIAAELNARGWRSINGWAWDAHGVVGVVEEDRRIRESDVMLRAQRLLARASR